MLIGVNLSSNAYPTGIFPHPLIPSPPAGNSGHRCQQRRETARPPGIVNPCLIAKVL